MKYMAARETAVAWQHVPKGTTAVPGVTWLRAHFTPPPSFNPSGNGGGSQSQESPGGGSQSQEPPGGGGQSQKSRGGGSQSQASSSPEALLLNATGLGRGHAYLNGRSVGRYWSKMRNDGSDRPSQALYVLPAEWLAPGGGVNTLVVAEVGGAVDLSAVSLSVARMAEVTPEEAAEAAATVTGAQRTCQF